MRLKFSVTFLIILFFSSGCRKDIDVPNTELDKIFGKWDWYETSGGINGMTYTPNSEGYIMRIEFTKKGVYKTSKNNAQNGRARFDLSEGTTIFGNLPANIITYHGRTGFLGTTKVDSKQSIKFWGTDTLILIDESFDGYNHYYVKKY